MCSVGLQWYFHGPTTTYNDIRYTQLLLSVTKTLAISTNWQAVHTHTQNKKGLSCHQSTQLNTNSKLTVAAVNYRSVNCVSSGVDWELGSMEECWCLDH